MKKSISSRIKITKNGMFKHRKKGLGHSRANKNRSRILKKKNKKTMEVSTRFLNKNIKIAFKI